MSYYPFPGEKLHKVGWRTGWTAGNVINTCKDITTNSGNVVKLCQGVVEKPSSAPSNRRIAYYGDSGAPVLRLDPIMDDGDIETEAPIAKGVLWGGDPSIGDPSTGDTFYFSSFQEIRGQPEGFATLSGFPRYEYLSPDLD